MATENVSAAIQKITEHPDFQELIAKLGIGTDPSEIHEWLKAKYGSVGEKSLVISEKNIKLFKNNYFNFYQKIREDVLLMKQNEMVSDSQLKGIVQGDASYKQKLAELVDKEIDIKKTIQQLVVSIQHRASQVFDSIQEDPSNIKMDRTLIEWFNLLMNALEKANKIVNEAPDQVIQHNVTVQHIEQNISVFADVVKEILSKLDYDTSMMFLDLYNEKMSQLREPKEQEQIPTEVRLNDAKILSGTIIPHLDNEIK